MKKDYSLLELGELLNEGSYRFELNALCDIDFSSKLINDIVNSAPKEFCNGDGKSCYCNSNEVGVFNAKYIKFAMDRCFTPDKKQVYGWFYRRNLSENFKGVKWGTESVFRAEVERNKSFTIGALLFDTFEDGYFFVNDLVTIVNENNIQVSDYETLYTYLEELTTCLHISGKQDHANSKVIFSKGDRYVMFSSGLNDKQCNEIMIFGEVQWCNNKMQIHNPKFRLDKLPVELKANI